MVSEQILERPVRQVWTGHGPIPRPSPGKAARDLIDRTTRRFPGLYQTAYHLLASEMTPELHRSLVDRLIGWSRTTPFYAGLDARELADFPLIDKARVLADPAAFRRGSLLPSSVRRTSGTTGTPLELARSPHAVVYEQAFIDFIVSHAGIRLATARVAVLRGQNIKALDDTSGPFWRASGRTLTFSSNHLSRETAPRYIEALREFRPDVLMAYPSVVENLVHLSEQHGLSWHVPLVVTSSETLTASARAYITGRLQCRLFDYYGQGERVAGAVSTEPGAYYFVPSYGHVECLDDGNGEPEIVGTSFHNRSQVLIRYRTGDRIDTDATTPAELADVAMGRRPFAGVLGRKGDVLLLPGGRKLVGMDQIARDLQGIGRLQFVQEAPNRVRILVQFATDRSAGVEADILRLARLKIPSSVALAIEFTDELEQTAAGKTPLVVRKVTESDVQ